MLVSAVAERDAGQAVQFKKAAAPMLVTLSGIVTLVRLSQARNANAPMLVTLPGIVTLVTAVGEDRILTIPNAGDQSGC